MNFHIEFFYQFNFVSFYQIYVEFYIDQSPICKEKGVNEQYKKNLENNKAQALYRRIYRQKFMIAQRNKDSKTIQKNFEQWKREAKDRVNKMKKGKLTEDEVYKWLVESKQK